MIPLLPQIKLVGFTIDSKLRWGSMIDRLAKKARARIGALRRIAHLLESQSLKLMYTSFIRSIMEYGSVAWMGAAQSHLDKLDSIQETAQRIGSFKVEPLQARREAAALYFSLKLLSGSCKGVLNRFVPQLYCPSDLTTRDSRHTLSGIQVKPVVTAKSLNTTVRGFHGVFPNIWSRLPQKLVTKGQAVGWHKINSRCKKHIINMD